MGAFRQNSGENGNSLKVMLILLDLLEDIGI